MRFRPLELLQTLRELLGEFVSSLGRLSALSLVASLAVLSLALLVGRLEERERGYLELQRSRFAALRGVLSEYASLSASRGGGQRGVDPFSATVSLVDRLGLKGKATGISPASGGVDLKLERLYFSELALLLQELERAGLVVLELQIRVLSLQEGRFLNASMRVEGG